MTYGRIVRFADTDAAGVVYFANVLNFCHEAYEDSLLHQGIVLPQMANFPRLALPITHAEVNFKLPLVCGDHLNIGIKPEQIDSFSYEINFQVIRLRDEKLAAQARTRHVCLDIQTRHRCELPSILQAWLSAYAGHD
ncbi:thioesterase family protein [Thermosynechococcaceae cyanobacterium BACA0444]|uniref:1,4-dihydroxy-2-naphthoyl-CoA hydrolase n=1 Tax=Pseudocalidococcus azoricus BACA0444 TaxID=2918990 RepID=A0AAE4FS18_9CYAN|nr:thioesterase family protein [Pseudocalidococcus azoricus]MDS3861214.1 thioesterase family protein [Pseudocalidococcus azoricus BACA0444]